MNLKPVFQQTIASIFAVVILAIGAGCGQDNNRVPTTSEIQAADTNRLSAIDKMNIPESQKAIMKSHLGGPSVASPMDAAKAGAAATGPGAATGRR